MNCGNDCERKKELKNYLIQLDLLFQWLAAVENKPIEQDGAEMGSNFAKFKIYPEYSDFIDYACEAEIHFSGVSDGNYHSVGTDCRMSLEGFMTYLYENKKLQLNEEYYKHTVKDEKLWCESNRVKDSSGKLSGKSNWKETDPKGYELSSKIGPDGKPRKLFWLDATITSKEFQDFFKKNNAWPYATEKRLAAAFSHYKKDKTFYSGEKALSILSMIYNLYAHCVDKKFFAGTPCFDVSLLENCPKDLIKPQLTIKVNGKEEKIPQNVLHKAVLSKRVSTKLIEENKSLINKTDVLGNTPLSLAVYNDDYETVKTLLENGADPNFYFKNWRAFDFGGDFHKSVFEEILKKNKYSCVFEEYIEAHNCIPLIVAIKKDNVRIVKLLLEYGAKTWDSCIDDWYGVARIPTECSTLLTCAIYYNAASCIEMLLNKEIIDNKGKLVEVPMEPEWCCPEDGYGSRKIYGTIEGVTALMLAAERANFDIVDQLLDKGARLDLFDKCRNSVFLHAVQDKRINNVLGILLRSAIRTLGKEKTIEIINHSGLAGCPISYVNKKDADLLLNNGADVNAKNEYGLPCVVDVAHLNPDMLPWFKEHGAKLDFTVPLDNIPRISPLVDAILFSKAYEIQNSTKDGKKSEKVFLSDAQLKELHDKYPVIKELSKLGRKISGYSQVKERYSFLEKLVNEGQPVMGSQKNLTDEEILKLPKHKLNFNIDMTLDEVYKAIASVKELSKAQRVALFERYPFTKELEKRGIDLNVPEEIESNYNTDKLIQDSLGKQINWENTPDEIMAAIKDVKSAIPYEDIEISPLDDALIAKNYDAAAIYLTNGSSVSDLTKILFLSVHDVPKKDISAWKKVLDALKLRKDIDFSDVLIHLCKNHPKDGFDIAEEFVNNGYNFYRFANYTLPDFWVETFASGISNCDYAPRMHRVKNEDGTYNESPSIEDIRKRNNSSFLKTFGETSFQDVNLRLIKNAISFGANSNKKTALEYAKENGIDESIFAPSNDFDIYAFIVDMKPSQKGSILGHLIDSDGKSVKGSIPKNSIPEGKSASDYLNKKIKVIKTSELQIKQAGEPYYKLDFAP